MKTLGLDIGTTTVSAVVVENGTLLTSVTKKNGYFIDTGEPFAKCQDVARIEETAFSALEELLSLYPDVSAIGVTGQMHGILYLDENGTPLSPLYTWQDGRGDLPYLDGESYASYLSKKTGYALATGYGCVTHFYNQENGLVPEGAVVFSTIHDYIAMRLSGLTRPVTDPTDAASFGLFDVEAGAFDASALKAVGIESSMLPALSDGVFIGKYQGKIAVAAAIGDNQASFLGTTGGKREGMLLNVGTGSQFSAYSDAYIAADALETRPFPGGGYLLVGASLCGGRAYALLEKFFRETALMLGVDCARAYDAMDALAAKSEPISDPITVTPLFSGTRKDPSLRGSIENLSTENFTPRHLITGMMEGMARELYEMYRSYLASGGTPSTLYGSGNGLRVNPYLQKCFEKLFETPLTLSSAKEEAATGAALYAAN